MIKLLSQAIKSLQMAHSALADASLRIGAFNCEQNETKIDRQRLLNMLDEINKIGGEVSNRIEQWLADAEANCPKCQDPRNETVDPDCPNH